MINYLEIKKREKLHMNTFELWSGLYAEENFCL